MAFYEINPDTKEVMINGIPAEEYRKGKAEKKEEKTNSNTSNGKNNKNNKNNNSNNELLGEEL